MMQQPGQQIMVDTTCGSLLRELQVFLFLLPEIIVAVAPAVSFIAWYTTMVNNAHDYSSVFFSRE